MSVTGAQLATVGVLVAIVTGLLGVYFLARQSSRESARLRAEETARRIKEATDPLREELQAMTSERDYQRRRADDLARELRGRETR